MKFYLAILFVFFGAFSIVSGNVEPSLGCVVQASVTPNGSIVVTVTASGFDAITIAHIPEEEALFVVEDGARIAAEGDVSTQMGYVEYEELSTWQSNVRQIMIQDAPTETYQYVASVDSATGTATGFYATESAPIWGLASEGVEEVEIIGELRYDNMKWLIYESFIESATIIVEIVSGEVGPDDIEVIVWSGMSHLDCSSWM
jgi:hypothetical protein